MGGLITCDLSGADSTPTPGLTNQSTSPLSSLIGWEVELIKAKPIRASPRSLLLELAAEVTEQDIYRMDMSLETRGYLFHHRDLRESPLYQSSLFLVNSFQINFTTSTWKRYDRCHRKLKILKHVQNELFFSFTFIPSISTNYCIFKSETWHYTLSLSPTYNKSQSCLFSFLNIFLNILLFFLCVP